MPPAAFARQSGFASSTIDNILKGTIPRADNAVRIARALGVSVEWLLTGEGPPPGAPPEPGEGPQAPAPAVPSSGLGCRQPPQATASAPPRHGAASAYERAAATVDRAAEIARVEPSEALRVALMQILFRHDIPAEDVALLLAATHPGGRHRAPAQPSGSPRESPAAEPSPDPSVGQDLGAT